MERDYKAWLQEVDRKMLERYNGTFTRHNIRPYDYRTAFYDDQMTPEDAMEDAMEANQSAMLWEIDLELGYME